MSKELNLRTKVNKFTKINGEVNIWENSKRQEKTDMDERTNYN